MIPNTTAEKIKEALVAFDRGVRDTKGWRDWQFRKTHKYAISHRGQWYPVKKIISMATGFPVDRYSGGKESNDYLGRLGVETIALLPKLIYDPDLHSRTQALSGPNQVPAARGVYAWFFRDIPPRVPVEGCVRHKDLTLLYVGISPSKPPRNGKPPSKYNLRIRIRQHLAGNAAGSTLRLTLGCLLADTLGIELRRVRSGKTRTFHAGEERLSEWMVANAFVAWWECEEPWLLEDRLIGTLSLPLNLMGNRGHPFHPTLTAIRKAAKESARSVSTTLRHLK
jgi:GIY-YIG catalytic domain-containing protein